MLYTLITGASTGIGKHMALECARLEHNLILAALPSAELEKTANEIREEYQVNVITYGLDLTCSEEIKRFYNWFTEQGFQVNILINNAGMGLQGKFCNISLEENLKMINLNLTGLVTLTYYFMPILKKQEQAYVLNVGSIASYLKFPYKAVYSGTKNFVLSFSNALSQELKDEDVSVSCLCPGPTITNALVEARTVEQGYKARVLTLPASIVAKKGIYGMLKGKRTIIPGKLNHLLIIIIKHLPSSTSTRIADRIFANSQHK